MYDNFSMNLLKSGVFNVLIDKIVKQKTSSATEHAQIARVFELCACHTDGIKILKRYMTTVMEMIETFMTDKNDL